MSVAENKSTEKTLKRKDTVFEDVGEVQFEEDIGEETLNLSNTLKDKLTFTIFAMNIYFTCFLVGWAPNYFYIWYTVKALIFIPYRWYCQAQMRRHYLTLEFCYFANIFVLLYLWIPSQILGDNIRGHLFPVCFTLSMAPVFFSCVSFQNSLVLHSTDKMTLIFIHASPAYAMWGILQFSTGDQGFPLCAHQTEPGVDGCKHVGYYETVFLPMMAFYVWQILYILIVEILCKKRIQQNHSITLCDIFLKQGKRGLPYVFYTMFGEKYFKPMFYIMNCVVNTIIIQLGYICYHSNLFSIFIGTVIMMVVSYNGASYYVEVFSKRYYSERVLNSKQRHSGAKNSAKSD